MDGGMMAGMGLWMALVAITLISVLVVAVLGSMWLLRRLRNSNAGPTRETPQELLRRRYAAGKMDDAEFERRLAALTWH